MTKPRTGSYFIRHRNMKSATENMLKNNPRLESYEILSNLKKLRFPIKSSTYGYIANMRNNWLKDNKSKSKSLNMKEFADLANTVNELGGIEEVKKALSIVKKIVTLAGGTKNAEVAMRNIESMNSLTPGSVPSRQRRRTNRNLDKILFKSKKYEAHTEEDFICPLLHVLNESSDQRLKCSDAQEKISELITLNDADMEDYPTGGIRWKINVRFARQRLVESDCIKFPEYSGHGIWELTPKGVNYANKMKVKLLKEQNLGFVIC